MTTLKEIRRDQRAEGTAAILGIGTAMPPYCIDQATFPDYYFRITNSENSMIKKRYMHLTEELISENPNIAAYMAPSLNARQEIVTAEVPKLGKEAAEKAIDEWGLPKSKITHLVFCTSGGVDMPGADYELTKLLGLSPSVNRCMIYQQGCFGGGTALRMAKDLAENNAGARVLVACSESTASTFRGPSETHLENLIGQALFGDGAAAVIVGCDVELKVEAPLFYIVSAAQAILPDSEGGLFVHMREAGMIFHLAKQIPSLISINIERILKDAFKPLGISDWNSIFWIAHPGGPAILDKMETELGLDPDKLRSSRDVLRDYGNAWSTSVLIVLDEMRKSSAKKGLSSTGEGLDWGVLVGFGPGVTVETVVLRSAPIDLV